MEWLHARKGALSLSPSNLILVSRGPLIRITEPPDALVAADHVLMHVTRIFVRGTGSYTHVAGPLSCSLVSASTPEGCQAAYQ